MAKHSGVILANWNDNFISPGFEVSSMFYFIQDVQSLMHSIIYLVTGIDQR